LNAILIRRPWLVALVLAAPWSAAAQEAGKVPKVPPSSSAPRGEVLEALSPEGQPFWYRLPKKIDERKPPALIFMLHGTGMPWGWAFWNYPIASGQLRPDDVVVAPEGLTPGGNDTFNFVQGKKDGEQIAGLVKLFRKELPIGKVYLYGHSQGAFFCYWFAGAYPELVDGIVAHAGNVLDVQHSDLARSKVAIGILHGRADAVVPVDCAFRTEQIYKEQGYRKVKLLVVEGLNEQTGHWPLPLQVAEMFEWLDQVSLDQPAGALSVARAELAKEAPDLLVIVHALDQCGELLKTHKGEDKARVAADLEVLPILAFGARDPRLLAEPRTHSVAQAGAYLVAPSILTRGSCGPATSPRYTCRRWRTKQFAISAAPAMPCGSR
jgi:predicted esterase